MSGSIHFESIPGLIGYPAMHEVMTGALQKRIAGEIPDTVFFLEHEPVITRGRGLQHVPGLDRARHSVVNTQLLGQAGIPLVDCERGGDLTYHGPGQLVIYPILKISDLGAFLRGMEQAVVNVLSRLGLQAEGRENAAGVWVGERKVASLGIAVKKWVTWHGIAINVVNDLAPFQLMNPCGFEASVMTNVRDLLSERGLVAGSGVDLKNWRGYWERELRGQTERLQSSVYYGN